MKEGIVQIPEDIIILEEVRTEEGKSLKELPLADVADSQAERIRKAIEIIEEEKRLGNNNAGWVFGFHRNDDESERYINYRVVLKGSTGAINP